MTEDTGFAPARQTAVIVNPTKLTDAEAAQSDIADALAEAGWPAPQWIETTAEDPGRGQVRAAIAAGAELIFSYGGDGTVRACASGLLDTDVPLAILPAGTGNLLARNMDIPIDLRKAIAVATRGVTRRIDVGTVDDAPDECFTVMAGMGFDAHMMGDAAEAIKARIGWAAYVPPALRHLTDRRMRLQLRLDDGAPIRRSAQTVLVANVGKLQGGLAVLPDAVADDGQLDVAVLAPRTVWDWLRLALAVVRRQSKAPMRETWRVRTIDIVAGRDQPRELDGDVIAPGRRLTARIKPAALTVCVPAA